MHRRARNQTRRRVILFLNWEADMNKNVREMFDLTGRTAIVTGGSRGLGKEIAEGLGEAGANLVLCARRAEWLDETLREFETRGFEVKGKTCDVSNPDDVQAL